MANVKIVFNPINVTNPVILRVEYTDAPGAAVFSNTFQPPHTQRNFTVTDLDPKMCRFFFWESHDGISLDTLLGSADLDASIAEDAILEVLEFVVDRGSLYDPVSGSTFFTHPDLLGASLATPGANYNTTTGGVYQVYQRGVGPKLSTELANRADGGFDLIGDAFNPQDVWIVNIYRRVIGQSTGSASSGSRFQDVIVKTDDFTIDETMYNCKILANGVGPVLTITFGDLKLLTKNKFFFISTHGGAQNYTHLIFTGANQGFYYKGKLVSDFYMAVGETIELQVVQMGADATTNQLDGDYTGNAAIRGRIVKDYTTPFFRPGYVIADGTKYQQAAFPGLYAFVHDMLQAGVACDPVTWALQENIDGRLLSPNKSRYAINTDPADMYVLVPDLRDLVEKNLLLSSNGNPDANRDTDVPGGFQVQKIMEHTHSNLQGTTKRGGGSDPSGQAWLAPGGDALGGQFTFTTGNVSGGKGSATQRVDNYGVIPLVTL